MIPSAGRRCQYGSMNKPYIPRPPHNETMTISFRDLETAWRMLASPDKHQHIEDAIETLKTLNRTHGPEKAIFNMVAIGAYLTDDGTSSEEG